VAGSRWAAVVIVPNYDWGVTHPSEPNYVASTAGSFFGIQDDNPYWTHQVAEPNLGSQLEAAGLSWKTYQQSLPSVGFTGNNYPAGVVPGATAKLYASKHNPFVNYLALYGPVPTTSSDGEFPSNFTPNAAQQTELNKMVPDTQLATDLANGTVPNLSLVASPYWVASALMLGAAGLPMTSSYEWFSIMM
jgi:Phosphoesterase family